MFTMNDIKLLPQEALIKTGPVDHADWNYKKGVLGTIIRKRFDLCISLMHNSKYKRMLEIGYGSGVFFPELSKRAEALYGIDIHEYHDSVKEALGNHGIESYLYSSSAEKLHFESHFFDAIVAISSLEFIPDLDEACQEIARVMSTDGRFYVITPGISPILDFGFNFLTGKSAKEDFNDRRERIIPTLQKYFEIKQHKAFPGIGIKAIDLYNAFELKKK